MGDEILSIEQKHRSSPLDQHSLLSSAVPLSPLRLERTRRIEDCEGYAIADFANKYVGGGSLRFGKAQEEILFSIFPECCLSMGVCSVMGPLDAISISNCRRCANYTGYMASFRYTEPVDMQKSSPEQIIAIDSLACPGAFEFEVGGILREVNKAFCGFSCIKETKKGIATGKWGCGVFRCNPFLKTVIQWISASLAHQEMVMVPFGDREVEMFTAMLARTAGSMTVGELSNRHILA